MMKSVPWTAWHALKLKYEIPAVTLAEQLDGGQCFRWTQREDGSWEGVVGCVVYQLRATATGLQWRASAPGQSDLIHRYFDAKGQQGDWLTDLPWRSDKPLKEALQFYPGLRILTQPAHEVLIGFLCSSNKRILQIRQMVAHLAHHLGEPLGEGHHAWPTWEAVAQASEVTLKQCALGYRAAYLRGTAEILQRNPHWAEAWSELATPALLEKLQTLPGVGPKVASCVALFGFGRLESFPVDTWVVQVMSEVYGLKGWKPAQLEKFGQVHFGPAAGLAQQYLFSAMRHGHWPKVASK
jgi:N-glycosylase/DNA lyase